MKINSLILKLCEIVEDGVRLIEIISLIMVSSDILEIDLMVLFGFLHEHRFE